MVARSGDQLHDGRIYSHPPGACHHHGANQSLLREQTISLSGFSPTQENWRFNMNTKAIVAVILVTLGIVVLAYSGITFKTPGKPIDFLGMHMETTHSHFIPPVVGALALVGGIVLLLVKPKPV
jgi:hypothetical protein